MNSSQFSLTMQDWRTQSRTLLTTPSHSSESMQSVQSLPSTLKQPANPTPPDEVLLRLDDQSDGNALEKLADGSGNAAAGNAADGSVAGGPIVAKADNLIDFSPKHSAASIHPVGQTVKVTERRRSVSECIPSSTKSADQNNSAGDSSDR